MMKSDRIKGTIYWLERNRKRFVRMLLLPILSAAGFYYISDAIMDILTKPLMGEELFFFTPVEGIYTKLKISFYGGLIVSSPGVAFILVSLIGKSLKNTKGLYYWLIPASTCLLAGGTLFGYVFVLPATVQFLLNSANGFMKAMLSGSKYVSFVIFLLLILGLVFELPLIMVMLSKLGIIKAQMLKKSRKYAIIVILILLALLTPTPDVFTLLAVSVPMIGLYELSIWWIYLLEKADRKKRIKNSEVDS